MKIFSALTVLLLCIFSSCNKKDSNQQQAQIQEPPKPLQDISYPEFVSKRGSSDLVEEQYQDLKEKTPELADIHEQIRKVQQEKTDSSAGFINYDRKNDNYYQATQTYVASIKDSILKNKIKNIIESSLNSYSKKISGHQKLKGQLDSRSITLEDLYTALKLVRTLSVMQEYQDTHLPSATTMKNTVEHFDQVIKKTDELIKK